jgi:hypothetical protein
MLSIKNTNTVYEVRGVLSEDPNFTMSWIVQMLG